MKKVNLPMLLLAILVIAMFIAVGFGIALRSIWLVLLFTVMGFLLMGFGLSIKRRKSDSY